jgi:hypothetical protein
LAASIVSATVPVTLSPGAIGPATAAVAALAGSSPCEATAGGADAGEGADAVDGAGAADGAGAVVPAGAAVSGLAAEREHPARRHDETATSVVRKREVVTGMARRK